MKLVLEELEASALRAELSRWDGVVASALLGVEAVRACARVGSAYAEQAAEGLADVSLLPIDDGVLRAASGLQPAELRSLDAIHLATALSLGADLGLLVVYDARLSAAASAHGMSVAAPR